MRLGRDILDRELKRYRSHGPVDLDEIAAEVGLTEAEQLYAALGSGDLSVGKIVGKFIPQKPKRRSIFRRRDRRGISIQGMEDLMIHDCSSSEVQAQAAALICQIRLSDPAGDPARLAG